MLLNLSESAAAMTELIAKHPLLPARDLVPSADGIKVNLHDGLGDFEAWREALDIPASDVTFAVTAHNTTLHASTYFAGVWVSICGYSSPISLDAKQLKAVA